MIFGGHSALVSQNICTNLFAIVLYHQPEKMIKSKEDLEARRESLAQLKKQHGID
jgi:pre-mRNA branch site protein p14